MVYELVNEKKDTSGTIELTPGINRIIYRTPLSNFIPKVEKSPLIEAFYRLNKEYIFRNFEHTKEYISDYQFLIPTLLDCPVNIKKYFSNEKLFLEVITDPMDNEETLALYISTTLDAEKAVEKLETFDDEWWLEFSSKTFGKLVIDVEFR